MSEKTFICLCCGFEYKQEKHFSLRCPDCAISVPLKDWKSILRKKNRTEEKKALQKTYAKKWADKNKDKIQTYKASVKSQSADYQKWYRETVEKVDTSIKIMQDILDGKRKNFTVNLHRKPVPGHPWYAPVSKKKK